MKHTFQTSDSIILGSVLALSGGFMDAYSYIERGKVFANAQTGNMLLFGVNLAEGNYTATINYLFPVLAFTIGIFLADLIRSSNSSLHWRQISVAFEALILVSVAFFPLSMNLPANALTSFACGIQVESFRKIHGKGIATTMCIGNLRSGTENLHHFLSTHKKQYLHNALLYFGIILIFILGAITGNFFIKIMGTKAILICSLLLLIAFLMMFFNKEDSDIV